MLTLLAKTLATNARYVAVGVTAVALFGGTATTVALSGSATPTPAPKAAPSGTSATEAPDDEASEAADDAAEAAKEAAEEKAGTGTRPTDTHGYCVSHAVAAAKAKGKTGKDIAAAAHSCAKPGKAAKAAAKAARKAAPKVAPKAPGVAPTR